jgi:hypothetical protein
LNDVSHFAQLGAKLTFNATSILISHVLDAGFAEYESPRPIAFKQRRVFLSADVVQLLSGDEAIAAMFPSVEAERLLSTFCKGHLVTMSETRKVSDVEKLMDLDEAWAFCFRRPRPGWRVFGRFIEPSVFVGLRAYDRDELGPSRQYHAFAQAMVDEWDRILPDVPPLRAAAMSGYVNGVMRNVDED